MKDQVELARRWGTWPQGDDAGARQRASRSHRRMNHAADVLRSAERRGRLAMTPRSTVSRSSCSRTTGPATTAAPAQRHCVC
jgi:hypothetical protein